MRRTIRIAAFLALASCGGGDGVVVPSGVDRSAEVRDRQVMDFGTCTVGVVEDCSILVREDACNYDEDACLQYIDCYTDF